MSDFREEFLLHVENEQICGEHAFAYVQLLCEAVPPATRRVVLSLRGAEELDSLGVAALIRMRAQLGRQGCAIRLQTLPDSVADQLKKIGLRDLFANAPVS
ncbi:MAG: STAS domain-containing protein [Myxococcota bacterium]